MAMSSTPSPPEQPKCHRIDARIFLAASTTLMILAFSAGILICPLLLNNLSIFPTEPLQTTTVSEHHVNFEHNAPPSQNPPESPHQPAGQHLLVDIRNVESDFLNSEERLADAMVSAVSAGGLTLLSYHCHSLVPAGVSCVGVLLESHVSFHTWPEEGVITLDLFTCGSKPLIPVVPMLKDLFGVPRRKTNCAERVCELEEPEVLWSHELRGFRNHEDRKKNYLDWRSDLAAWVTSPLDLWYKREIVNVESEYQKIDVWDRKSVRDMPSHEDGIALGFESGDERWMDSTFATPERLLFLDGVLQTRTYHEREFHEALVHPAMLAHPDPKRVAIIGGGEGATLREVLKHNTVEHVKMIEIDGQLVQIAKEYLPELSNCDDIINSSESCFDDPRAELLLEDARPWFLQRYGPNKSFYDQPLFDVIILDILDPDEENIISSNLYTDPDFFTSLLSSLTMDGIMVIQVGMAPTIHDLYGAEGIHANRDLLIQKLEDHPQTAAMLIFEEAHTGFLEPHSFLIICKSVHCRHRWYSKSDVVDFEIHEKLFNTKSGNPALVHYDGGTQYGYQFTPIAWQTSYCRKMPKPLECEFERFYTDDDPRELDLGSVEVRRGEDGKVGLFALQQMQKGRFLLLDDMVSSFFISNTTLGALVKSSNITHGKAHLIENLLSFIQKHGHKSLTEGVEDTYVEIGSTIVVREVQDRTEANVERLYPLPEGQKRPKYSPIFDRHQKIFDLFIVTTRDIQKGEEILKWVNIWD